MDEQMNVVGHEDVSKDCEVVVFSGSVDSRSQEFAYFVVPKIRLAVKR
jgi:hypothetical protein